MPRATRSRCRADRSRRTHPHLRHRRAPRRFRRIFRRRLPDLRRRPRPGSDPPGSGARSPSHRLAMGQWRVLEEVALADCALDIEGRDLDDLFETAAQALAHLMVDPRTVSDSVERAVGLEAEQLDLLLY